LKSDECTNLLVTRQSIRKFTDADVLEEDIQKIIEIGLKAPSAGNRQPWRIVIVKEAGTIQKLADASHGQNVVSSSKVLLAIFAVADESSERYGDRGANLYSIQDTAALTTYLLLGVHFIGYGACWVGAFDEKSVSKILNAPTGFRPVALIPIGSPEIKPPFRPRRNLSEVVIQEHF